MEENAKNLARLLKVLANEHRLMVLCYLLEEDLTVSQLHEKVSSISQSALSQHLALLRAHDLVDSSKEGQNVTYSILDKRVKEVIEVLKAHYC